MWVVLFSVLSLLFVGIQWLTLRALWRAFPRFARRVWRSRARWPAIASLAWLNVAPFAYFATELPLPAADSLGGRLLLYPSFVWMLTSLGASLLLGLPLLFEAVVDILRTRSRADAGPADPSRRRFVRAATGGAVLMGATSSVYATYVGSEALEVQRLTLRHPRLPAGFDGVRIAQISDLHVGKYMSPDRLRTYVDRTNEEGADLVVVTGDIVDDVHDDLPRACDALGRLAAPLGVYAILGNHDHWYDPAAIRRAVEAAGIPVLTGAAVTFAGKRPDGERVALVGVDDLRGSPDRTYEPLLQKALTAVPPGADFRVLLSHRPNVFPAVADVGVPLTLAGHTHGGQAIFPLPGDRGVTIARLRSPYDHGLFRRGDGWLYVNRGLGVSGLPVRFNCPREITVITLRKGPTVEASIPAVVV